MAVMLTFRGYRVFRNPRIEAVTRRVGSVTQDRFTDFQRRGNEAEKPPGSTQTGVLSKSGQRRQQADQPVFRPAANKRMARHLALWPLALFHALIGLFLILH